MLAIVNVRHNFGNKICMNKGGGNVVGDIYDAGIVEIIWDGSQIGAVGGVRGDSPRTRIHLLNIQ